MPKPYECAFFSHFVYAVGQSSESSLEGWESLKISAANNVGYYGQAFINNTRKIIIIAHRGTEPRLLGNLTSDVSIGANLVPQGQSEAEKFSFAVAQLNLQNYKIVETGHSLGAVHAEINAAKTRREFITFDSPGAFGILSETERRNSMGVCYVSAPNIVNTANEHTGKLVRVFVPHVKQEGQSVEDVSLILDVFRKIITLDSSILLNVANTTLSKTARLHSMLNILATFDKKTGYPYLAKEVITWPRKSNYIMHLTLPSMDSSTQAISWLQENARVVPQITQTNRRLEASLNSISNYKLADHFTIPPEVISEEQDSFTLAFKQTALEQYDNFFVSVQDRATLISLLKFTEHKENEPDKKSTTGCVIA